MPTHHFYMSSALQLAERGRFNVSPNPMVGCVIVKDDQIVGEGFHQSAGGPHAEILALQQAKEKARDATVYVTLEPCCHYGRTPPCTDALIQAGIKKIYIACLDPNPLVSGKGVMALNAAGIETEIGLCDEAAKKLNKIFFHYMNKRRPFVISKWAMSLDGRTITATNDSKQISNQAAQFHCHQLRQQVDAILVGANTIREDDPQLTVRFAQENTSSVKQPVRIILTHAGDLPPQSRIFQPDLPGKTWVVSVKPLQHLPSPIENIILPANEKNNVSLTDLLTELAKRQITSLLIEGGMHTHEAFFKENLVDQTYVYIAPTIIGDTDKKQSFKQFNYFSLDNNLCICIDNKESDSHV